MQRYASRRLCHRAKLNVRFPAILPHRVAAHVDAMGIVNQPVEDTVRSGRIADLFVPARHRQLGSEDGRARLVAILTDLPEVTPLGFGQRSHGPVVDHQHIDAAESREHTAQTAIYQLHAKLYYTFQTGTTVYESGRKALRRKNAACESFKVR